MNPAISVVIPTCGRVELLRETLASLEVQTLRSFEAVICDDSAANQDREAIAAALADFARRARVATRYIHTRGGLYQAANTNQGLAAAQGRLIRILHSDDLLRPDALERESACFAQNPGCELLFQDCLPFTTQPNWGVEPRLMLLSPALHLRGQLAFSTALPSGLVFSRELLARVGGMRDELRFLCDWEFFFRLLLDQIERERLVLRLSAGLYAWRVHGDSVTGKLWKTHYLEHRLVLGEILAHPLVNSLGLFTPSEKQAFLCEGEHYRYKRLREDFAGLPRAEQLRQARWYLGARIERRGVLKSVGRAFKSWSRALRGKKAPAQIVHSEPAPEFTRQVFGSREANRGDLAITPCYDGRIDATHDQTLVCDFDNTLNLWPERLRIAAARRLRLFYPNQTRMFDKALHETLKYVARDQRVEITLVGNEHLQFFGLKAAVDRLFPGQFRVESQADLGEGFRRAEFRRAAPVPEHLRGEHSGWSFGLLTLGREQDRPRVERFLRSLASAAPAPYECLVVAPHALDYLAAYPFVRQILFSERDDLGWITRKKNLICEAARYSDLLICHDRYELTPEFCLQAAAGGFAYGLAAPRVTLPDGSRALDWAVVSSQNHSWSYGGLLDYRSYSPYAYVPGGATLIRQAFWRLNPWDENLYWNEHEDVELCRRAQRSGEVLALSRGRLVTATDRWIDQNPLIPYDPRVEHLYGAPAGEQQIHFHPLPSRGQAA